jgi:lysophospholipase L1-like esterase
MTRSLRIGIVVGLAISMITVSSGQSKGRPIENWVATWATAQDMAPTVRERPVIPPGTKMPDFRSMRGPRQSQTVPAIAGNQTIRMIVHTSIGGNRIRVELTNAFGKSPVSIGNAHVAIRSTASSILSNSDRQLKFGGSAGVDLLPGMIIVSDPVELQIAPMTDLAVSIFVAKADGVPTNHTIGLHTSYIADGNLTVAESLDNASTTTTYEYLRSVDVAAQASDFAIVCLGDSITDGYGTSLDANKAWPALLAERLNKEKRGVKFAVLNEGISGNQVLRDGAGVSALARFDRDVLAEPGVRWVVLLEGINDINLHGQSTDPGSLVADDLIRGYKELIARAHLHRIRMMGATLTPDEGVFLSGPIGEATRQKLNEWIRTSGEFDAVVDFDAVLQEKGHPARLREDFNPGDKIHPNDAGNAAMANAFDLSVFKQ